MEKTHKKEAHTPYAHTSDMHWLYNSCGCATEINNQENKIAVCQCGAAYDWLEVITFPPGVFRCYDCGRVYVGEMYGQIRSRLCF